MAVVITSICVLQEPSSLCKVLFWQLSSKPASATSWHCENYPFTIHTCVSCVPFRVWTLWTIGHAWESQAKSYGITGNWSANLRQILLQNMSCTSIPVKTWLMIVCRECQSGSRRRHLRCRHFPRDLPLLSIMCRPFGCRSALLRVLNANLPLLMQMCDLAPRVWAYATGKHDKNDSNPRVYLSISKHQA